MFKILWDLKHKAEAKEGLRVLSKYKLRLFAQIETSKRFNEYVKSLIERGYVEEIRLPLPGKQERGYYYMLTDRGEDFLEEAGEHLYEFLQIAKAFGKKGYF